MLQIAKILHLILLQLVMARGIAYYDSDLDAKALLDQGFVVVEEIKNASGVIKQSLVIAAPLLATVLLRQEKLTMPEDVELPDVEDQQDPW